MDSKLQTLLPLKRPLLILAPMQDVTDLEFWRVINRYGGPDLYYTEYFRVHEDSKLNPSILRSLRENPTGKPVIAQMIGQDIPALVRTAELLQKENIVGVDLNLGCPANIVCRKNAGGGLLRNPGEVDQILRALRVAVGLAFTVKTRIGYDRPEEFDNLLKVYSYHPIDALTVHGRTVRELYGPKVHYDRIEQAGKHLKCPIFANGNILRVGLAQSTVELTGASGLMIGRGAIRNPWIFQQIREFYDGGVQTYPTYRDLRAYLEILYVETSPQKVPEQTRLSKFKKFMNFIGPGIGGSHDFISQVRRSTTVLQFFNLCDRFLSSDEPLDQEPLASLGSEPLVDPSHKSL